MFAHEIPKDYFNNTLSYGIYIYLHEAGCVFGRYKVRNGSYLKLSKNRIVRNASYVESPQVE